MSRRTPPEQPNSPRRPLFDISLTQMLGGSLAAATAAFLGSRLGVVGTITGAAVISVVTAVAGALYTSSMRRTSERLRGVLSARPAQQPDRAPAVRRRVLHGVAGAAAVFGLAASAVTGFELVTGRSMTGTDGGTTLSQSVQGGSGTPSDPATPPSADLANSPTTGSTDAPDSSEGTGSGTEEATPSPTPSATDTPTEPEPTDEPTVTPSEAPSDTPSGTPSGTPTSEQTSSSDAPGISQAAQE